MIQDKGDKRRGNFCFRKKEDIRAIGSDQCPKNTTYDWMRYPSAIPRQDLYLQLGETTWSPKLLESSFSNTAEETLKVEAKVFFSPFS
jgi:hypothetical protein